MSLGLESVSSARPRRGDRRWWVPECGAEVPGWDTFEEKFLEPELPLRNVSQYWEVL